MTRRTFRPTRLRCEPLEDRWTPADIDLTFGVFGESTANFDNRGDVAEAVVIQGDGKIVMAGTADIGGRDRLAVVRLNADGFRDASFGTSGRVNVDVAGLVGNAGGNSSGWGVAIDSSNRIVVVGAAPSKSLNFDFAVVRLNPNGSLDTSFDGDGIKLIDFGGQRDVAYGVAISGSRILVGGVATLMPGFQEDFGVVALDSSGNFDNSFDSDGKVTTDLVGGNDTAVGIAVRPDGRIVVAGQAKNGASFDFAAAQYQTNGQLDNSFDTDGRILLDLGGNDDLAQDMTLLSSGELVIVGAAQPTSGGFDASEAAIAKFQTDGLPDPSFGGGDGWDTYNLLSLSAGAYAVAADISGGFVVAGTMKPFGGNQDFAAVRFDAFGNLDLAYGILSHNIDNGDDIARGVVVQSSGAVVAVGTARVGADSDFAAVRFADPNAANRDTDGDGMLDIWEVDGIDGNDDGVPDYRLPGAGPLRKDVFVEVDGMRTRTNSTTQAAINQVVTAFANAPVDNPDGSRGINLVVQSDEWNLTFASWAGEPNPFANVGSRVGSFAALKGSNFGTATERRNPALVAAKRSAFRYCIFADRYGAGTSSGLALNANFMVTLGMSSQTQSEQAGTFMHELGHTLGLDHAGNTGTPNNRSDYISVMSYAYQFGYAPTTIPSFPTYSSSAVPVYDDWANLRYAPRGGGAGSDFDIPKDLAEEEADITALFPEHFTRRLVVAPGPGVAPVLRVLNAQTGTELAPIQAFDSSFTGGVRVARADVTGDGIDDIIAGAGPGGLPMVRVFEGLTGQPLAEVMAFEPSFTGGVFVSAADFNGDGLADVLISPDQGGGPRVRILSGADGSTLADFFGIEDPNFRGGARIATGDVDGDGLQDLVVAAGFGGGPRIAVFDGRTVLQSASAGLPPKLMPDFFAFENALRNGAFVTAGDVTADGFEDLVFGAGPGGGPRVMVVSGAALLQNTVEAVNNPYANFFGGDVESRAGVHVGVVNADNDSQDDVVVGGAPGTAARVTTYAGRTLNVATPTPLRDEVLFDPTVLSGVFVG